MTSLSAARSGLGRATTFVIASDPGLNRLRMASSAAVNVSLCLAVEYWVATVLRVGSVGTTIFMILGAVVAMIGSNALAGRRVADNLRIGAFFPVAVGSGLVLGVAVSGVRVLTLVVFVVVMFAAVWVRRFGPQFFFLGFMGWMGYFFASFLGATVGMLGSMLLAVVIASAIVILMCSTVFYVRPRTTLALVFRSMDARSRTFARACAALLHHPDEHSARGLRRVRRTRARIRDTALMSDGWAAHAPALPTGWSAQALRSRLLDIQLVLDRVASSSELLARSDPAVRAVASDVLLAYAEADFAKARAGCALLRNPPPAAHARRAAAVSTATDAEEERARVALAGAIEFLVTRPAVPEAQQQLEDRFEPVAPLNSGELPGSVAVANDVTARGGRWNPLARFRLSTRQAFQVALAGALAIIAGSALSEQRYYWAVIAAFVAFAGTGTRYETVNKSLNRILGTLVGLVAGVLLANLTSGHLFAALAVVVASIFCGLYLVRVSYAYMIFFITIMISQLYSILGEFSDALLLLRLEETAIGAAIGILVALVVTPVSTRDTIEHAEQDVVEAVAAVLDSAASRFDDSASVPSGALDALMFHVDDTSRRLDLVAAPLTRYNLAERRPRAVRHRLAVLAALVSAVREIVASAQRNTESDPGRARSSRRLAALARAAVLPRDPNSGSGDMPIASVLTENIQTGAIEVPFPRRDGPAFERSVELVSELSEDRRQRALR